MDLYHKTNKEASTVPDSVLKNLEGGGAHSTASCVSPYTSFVLYHFLLALQQNRAQSSLLYLQNI